MNVQRIIFMIPDLEGGADTAKIEIQDGIGAELYDSGNKAKNSTHVIGPGAGEVFLFPMAGDGTLTVSLSASQTAAFTLYVLLYGI